LAHFEIGCELNRVCRTCLFAEAAEDTAREIDAKELRITPPAFVFGRLQRDAIHGAGHRAQITGHATLAAVRITRKDDSPSVPRRQVRFLVRILDCRAWLERV